MRKFGPSFFYFPREKWYSELRQYCPYTPVVCVANKIDADMSVTNRPFNFPVRNDLPLFFVSASSGVNVVRAFNESIKLAVSYSQNPQDDVSAVLGELIRTG